MSSELVVTEEGGITLIIDQPPAIDLIVVPPIETPVLIVHESGPQGPIGPTGPPGTAYFVHHQSTPASSWPIEHNLNAVRDPVVVLDSFPGEIVTTDVEVTDLNNLTLKFPSPESGWAYV